MYHAQYVRWEGSKQGGLYLTVVVQTGLQIAWQGIYLDKHVKSTMRVLQNDPSKGHAADSVAHVQQLKCCFSPGCHRNICSLRPPTRTHRSKATP